MLKLSWKYTFTGTWLLLAFVGYELFGSSAAGLYETVAELVAVRNGYEPIEEIQDQIKALTTTNNDSSLRLSRQRERLPSSASLSGIVRHLDRIAQEEQIVLELLEPTLGHEGAQEMQMLSLDLNFSGRFNNVLAAVLALESSGYRLSALQISPMSKKQEVQAVLKLERVMRR